MNGSTRIIVLKGLKKLEESPELRGAPLGSKANAQSDLTGFRKRDIYGLSVELDPTAVYAALRKRTNEVIDSMAALVNPTPPDSASLANGRKYYVINCSVCHGMTGKGDGTAIKYGLFPFPPQPSSTPRCGTPENLEARAKAGRWNSWPPSWPSETETSLCACPPTGKVWRAASRKPSTRPWRMRIASPRR